MISLKYMMAKTLLQIKLANMVVVQSQMILSLLLISYIYILNQILGQITKVLLHLSVQVSKMTSCNIFKEAILLLKVHLVHEKLPYPKDQMKYWLMHVYIIIHLYSIRFIFQYLMTKIKLTTLSVRMTLILVLKCCIFQLLWIAQINGIIVYVKIEMNVLMVQLHVEFIPIVKILMEVSHVFVILGILIHQVIL